ncbi:hypothetical protein G4Y79_23055 [Phototrophicus methaneseepsis]|uniref:Uncharacterized protein n=1 Tax=Phototrophicus methaneseepsis TaxID=2710758 RepID=A0A7S8IDF3_9CHLR|nr:hypothetical protein [Phototrophicus methaneseepsis]QPC82530.1 hypothetical protein G4Y79_23055 [Phototrophicus methaneseepsis]
MIRLRRRNTAWLTALGIVIAFAMLAGATTPAVQAVLLGIFAVAMVASMVELGPERESLLDAIRRAPIRQRISPQAKEATERAKSRGGYVNNDLMMLDVGLIAIQSSYEGMAMRRTRSVSKDDDGVRPFVTLYVDPSEAERTARIRFEIYNQFGDEMYIHEMRTFLREGEMSIMADHHLPLAGNTGVQGAGDWDLRIYVDGNLIGLQNFNLAPSINERSRRLARESAGTANNYFEVIDETPQEVPLRLQELLQNEASNNARQTRERASESRQPTSGPTRRRR